MASFFARLQLSRKALFELGLKQTGLYGLYRLGLRSGYFRWRTSSAELVAGHSSDAYALKPVLGLPERQELKQILGEDGAVELVRQADEICAGRVRFYGGEAQTLNLEPPGPRWHWTAYELGRSTNSKIDVKDIWETARFGWAFTLGRAYRLSGDERYPRVFWAYTLEFARANPPNQGMNWVSAQEVALRLIALVFAAQVFAESPYSSPERMQHLGWLVASHARRIPPTMVYARAQNNNHLLSEAAGLFTAGLALPGHPDSVGWRSVGWRWFNQGLLEQIQEHGAYTQHSTNYHRLMLQLALWVTATGREQQFEFPADALEKLQLATRWLSALLDPLSGGVPNLGPNDGAYIFPFTVCPFADHRPVLQAAAQAFLETAKLPAGQWDEMQAWLAPADKDQPPLGAGALQEMSSSRVDPLVLHSPRRDSWAYLRAARFRSRPGHADQLHLDLWWRGMNIAQDAGTYRYNAPEPWDNALRRSAVHNTLMVNDLDQMLPAGRFLWLDWAESRAPAGEHTSDGASPRLAAEHDGYRRLGITHRRSVAANEDGSWVIEDELIFSNPRRVRRHLPLRVRLHWLAPDWPWRCQQEDNLVTFELETRYGWIKLIIQPENGAQALPRLAPLVACRGEKLYGEGEAQPTWGWASPYYGKKAPALSFSVTAITAEPIRLISVWHLEQSGS